MRVHEVNLRKDLSFIIAKEIKNHSNQERFNFSKRSMDLIQGLYDLHQFKMQDFVRIFKETSSKRFQFCTLYISNDDHTITKVNCLQGHLLMY